MIPDDIFDGCTAILGRTGSGKSFTARGFVEGWLEQGRRVCVIDPTDVWWGLRSNAAGDGPGYPVVVFGGEHGDVPIGDRSGVRIAEIIGSRNLPAVICTAEMTGGERHRFMTDFLGTLYRTNRLPLHFVIDEADDVAPQNPLPENRRMLGDVDRIVRRGRVKGFRVLMITQRPAVLNKSVLNMISTLVAMRLPGPQDRKAVDAWIKGQAAGEEAAAVMNSLAGLQRGEGWVWAPEDGVLQRTKFPAIRTYDSMRTPEIGEAVIEPTRLAPVELGDLRKLLEPEAKPGDTPRGGASPDEDIDLAEGRGYDIGYQEGLVEGRRLERADWIENDRKLRAAINAAIGYLAPYIAEFEDGKGGRVIDVREPPEPLTIEAEPQPSPPAALPPPQRRERATETPTGGVTRVTGPQQKILDALAWWEAVRIPEPTRVQVAMIAGYSPNSGGFGNLLSALNTSGRISYPKAGLLALTETGRALAHRPQIPATTQALHERVYALLSRPQARVLSIIVAAYPAPVEREVVATRAGYSATSGGFGNLISALRSLGLIDRASPGEVIAQPILFIDKRPRAVGGAGG